MVTYIIELFKTEKKRPRTSHFDDTPYLVMITRTGGTKSKTRIKLICKNLYSIVFEEINFNFKRNIKEIIINS